MAKRRLKPEQVETRDSRSGRLRRCYHAATGTPRTRTTQEDGQLVRIALVCYA